jgi:hypothetical protein
MSAIRRWTIGGMAVMAALALAAPGWAADGDGGQAGALLTYGAGARAFGMGRAFVGLADDATAVYWNPGGLSSIAQNQAILQHAALLDGNSVEYLGYAHIFPYLGTLALGLTYLNQGAAEGRDSFNTLTGDFSNQQLGVLLGFGSDLTPTLAAGGAVKLVHQSMAGSSASGFGLDLGLMYKPWPVVNFAVAFQNLVAPSLTLVTDAEKYPLNLTFGVSGHFLEEKVKADLDLAKNMDQDGIKPRFGVEVTPMDDLHVRAGIDDTEIAVGAGYRYQGFQLDYAVGFQAVALMHKVSLSYLFGGFVLETRAEPETFSPVGINKVSVFKIACQTKFEVRVWTLEVRNEANALVKKYSGEGAPPDHLVWDALVDNNTPMPDGRYRVVFWVEDAAGQLLRAADSPVNIQSVLPLGVSPIEMEQ